MDLWIWVVSAAAAFALIYIIRTILKKALVFRKKQGGTGIPLEQYLGGARGKLAFDESIAMLEPVARKLAEMHTNGLCHLGVCPEVITVDPETRKAALLEPDSVVIRPGYSAPEQYSADGKTGTWTDVYALAAVLYRITAGENPPDAPARMQGSNAVTQKINSLAAEEGKRNTWIKAFSLLIESRTANCGMMALDLYAPDDEALQWNK